MAYYGSWFKFILLLHTTGFSLAGRGSIQFIYFSPQTSQNNAVNIMIKITSMEKKLENGISCNVPHWVVFCPGN
jgi:hypothetical protein